MTSYLQGSANTSRGNSASPVINREGDVVGIVAVVSHNLSTDLYSPIDKVRHAINCLKAEEAVPGETIQSTWILKSRAECDALGVKRTLLKEHSLGQSGLLLVEQVLPERPSHNKSQPGDILLHANNSKFESLTALENLLDQNIGRSICVRVYGLVRKWSITCRCRT